MSNTTDTFDYLENIIALLPGHVYWLDRNNVYLGCNDMQAKSAGLSSRYEIIGKRNKDLPWNNKEPALAELLDKINTEVMKTGIPNSIEEPAHFLDGTTGTFLSHKVPIKDKEHNTIGILGISIDITARKNLESKLLAEKERVELTLDHIIAHMPGHVYWKDKNGIYLGCNDLQARSLGLHYGYEVAGKSDFDLPWKNEVAAIFRQNDIDVMASGKPKHIEEIAQIEGKEAVVLSHKVPLKDKHQNIIGILGISIDITELKESEKRLIIAKEEAEAANHLKSEFIRNMEHDIRTPFGGIWGMVNILAQQETEPNKKQALTEVASCAKELLDYCNAILDFSKIESGQLPVLNKKFDLVKLINSIETMQRPAAQIKNIDFSCTIAENIPHILVGDSYRLQQILINLVSNAIKFTKVGFVKLSIEIEKKEERNIILNFIIKDSGIGIPNDKQDIIYEKFTRLSPSDKGSYKGHGLGLRIVKQFIEELDGDIDFKSYLNKGSVFICTLAFKLPLSSQMLEN